MKVKVINSGFLLVTLSCSPVPLSHGTSKMFAVRPDAKTSVWPLLPYLGQRHFLALFSTCVSWRQQFIGWNGMGYNWAPVAFPEDTSRRDSTVTHHSLSFCLLHLSIPGHRHALRHHVPFLCQTANYKLILPPTSDTFPLFETRSEGNTFSTVNWQNCSGWRKVVTFRHHTLREVGLCHVKP